MFAVLPVRVSAPLTSCVTRESFYLVPKWTTSFFTSKVRILIDVSDDLKIWRVITYLP